MRRLFSHNVRRRRRQRQRNILGVTPLKQKLQAHSSMVLILYLSWEILETDSGGRLQQTSVKLPRSCTLCACSSLSMRRVQSQIWFISLSGWSDSMSSVNESSHSTTINTLFSITLHSTLQYCEYCCLSEWLMATYYRVLVHCISMECELQFAVSPQIALYKIAHHHTI